MEFQIYTQYADCALRTSSVEIAKLFVEMVSRIITPANWLSLMAQISPEGADTARHLVSACLGHAA